MIFDDVVTFNFVVVPFLVKIDSNLVYLCGSLTTL
jgi:hypothetical protein